MKDGYKQMVKAGILSAAQAIDQLLIEARTNNQKNIVKESDSFRWLIRRFEKEKRSCNSATV
jgi:hypothetical protein